MRFCPHIIYKLDKITVYHDLASSIGILFENYTLQRANLKCVMNAEMKRMRKNIFRYNTVIIILLLSVALVFAQEQPKTVTDHLLALPANLFEYVHPGFKYENPKPMTNAEMETFRRSRIVVEDIKNGYIKYKTDPNSDNWTEIALFKKKTGDYLMAINEAGKYKGCESKLNFVVYNDGKWIDVTKQYSPKLNASQRKKAKDSIFCYELPREGRAIRLYSKWYDEPEDTWGYFHWDGERFIEKN